MNARLGMKFKFELICIDYCNVTPPHYGLPFKIPGYVSDDIVFKGSTRILDTS